MYSTFGFTCLLWNSHRRLNCSKDMPIQISYRVAQLKLFCFLVEILLINLSTKKRPYSLYVIIKTLHPYCRKFLKPYFDIEPYNHGKMGLNIKVARIGSSTKLLYYIISVLTEQRSIIIICLISWNPYEIYRWIDLL